MIIISLLTNLALLLVITGFVLNKKKLDTSLRFHLNRILLLDNLVMLWKERGTNALSRKYIPDLEEVIYRRASRLKQLSFSEATIEEMEDAVMDSIKSTIIQPAWA